MQFYVDDISFLIVDVVNSEKVSDNAVVYGSADVSKVMEHYYMVKAGKVKGKTHFVFIVKNYQTVVDEIKSTFKIIEAAGGIVQNEQQVLLIYRLRKWDLPKGKIEKGERPEITAVREVEEECNVKTKILHKIGETWHTYDINKRAILKCTYWYLMNPIQENELKPQTEEAIEEVKWVDVDEARNLLKKNSYASINDIFMKFTLP